MYVGNAYLNSFMIN